MHQFVKSVLLVLGITRISNVSAGTSILVKTNVGPISGSNDSVIIDGSLTYVARFTNIPFGETTAGVNRFAKPIPKAAFSDVFNATGKPVACYQLSTRHHSQETFTEDCLILNIYAPHAFQTGPPLDVMVWIYGGGFVEGFTSNYKADGLSTFGNVIVVTVSYRIGIFGFLHSADGRLTGNQGLWDQHLAIKWLHDNIAAFNGNPGHVTIFGESAGGASVLYQALYPGNKGLFQRVIAESGSPLAGWAYNNTPNADILASMTGCDQGKVDPIMCLRALPASQIRINPDEYGTKIMFRPSHDGEFLLGTPEELLLGTDSLTEAARHFYGSLDIIMGANNYDGVSIYQFVLEGLYKNIDIDTFAITEDQFQNDYIQTVVNDFMKPDSKDKMKILEDLLNFQYINWSTPNNSAALRMGGVELGCDINFFYPLFGAAQSHALQSKGKTFVYEFSAKPAVHVLPTPAWIDGANHGDEIPYVLGNLGFALYPESNVRNASYSQDEINLSKAMMTLWTNFAATGDPNLSRDATMYTHSVWPPYNDMSQSYLNIGLKMSTIQEHFYATRMQLWSNLIPLVQQLGHSVLPHHATTRPRERTTPPSAGPQPTQMFHMPDIFVGK